MPGAENPREDPAFGTSAREVRRQLDDILEALIATPEFEGVYLGPWWEAENNSAGGGTPVGWKRAVLRRRSVGAEHWGHVYLLVGVGTGPAEFESRSPTGGTSGARPFKEGGTLELAGGRARVFYRASPRADPRNLASLVERWFERAGRRFGAGGPAAGAGATD